MSEIKQITIKEFDERFYELDGIYKPSVTYIQQVGLPTPYELIKWIGETGWEQSKKLKEEAGGRGTESHDSIDRILKGEKVPTLLLDLRVKRSIQSFLDWYALEKPQIISHEYIIWADDYAGTVDLKCRIASDDYKNVWLIDYKTSKSLHENHKSQVVAYMKADHEVTHGALLHLGNTTQKRFTFSPIKDVEKYWKIFCAGKNMFQLKYPDAKPTIEAYPLEFMLADRQT